MRSLCLTNGERERLNYLVEILVDAQGIRRAREILKDNGLLEPKGPGGVSFKALIPDASAISTLIADRFQRSFPDHAALDALAKLARESWKNPRFDRQVRQCFNTAYDSITDGNWERYQRDLARIEEVADDVVHPLIKERHAVLALATRKPDRMVNAFIVEENIEKEK